jgi:DNA-binding IclR family transcriptional regulator
MALKSSEGNSAGVPAAELLSFLKDTRSASTWTERDLATALNLNREHVKHTLAALQLQGYAEPIGHDGKWRTTEAGELVSGGKPRDSR